MNSVHEPSPNGDSETVLNRKPGKKKLSQVQEHPAGPTGTPRCAQAHPGARMAVVSWPGPRPCRGKGPTVSQALVAVSQRPCRTPHALPPAPQRPSASACSPSAPAARPAPYRGCVCVQAWPYRGLPRDTVPSRLATLVTIHYVYCDTNAQPSSLPQSQYTRVYCDTNLASFSPSSSRNHNTKFVS